MPEIVVLLTTRPDDRGSAVVPGLASASYLESIAKGLERTPHSEADNLAACPPACLPVAGDGSLTRYETVCALMRKELP